MALLIDVLKDLQNNNPSQPRLKDVNGNVYKLYDLIKLPKYPPFFFAPVDFSPGTRRITARFRGTAYGAGPLVYTVISPYWRP